MAISTPTTPVFNARSAAETSEDPDAWISPETQAKMAEVTRQFYANWLVNFSKGGEVELHASREHAFAFD